MADAPRPRDTEGEARTPRWVYVVGIILILVALAFVAMHLAGGGIPSHQ